MRATIRKKLERRRAETTKEQRQRQREVALLLKRFGKYLRKRREQEALTFRQFAERAQMAHTNIFVIEESRKDPRLSELVRLAQGFNQSLRDFLEPLLQDEEALNAVVVEGDPQAKLPDLINRPGELDESS